MKPDIHPQYQTITFSCACGATYIAGSTLQKEFKTEICSNCHPFYTGKQKLIDTSGRVDKFVARMKKAQEIAEKKVKKVNKGEEEITAKTTEILPTKPAAKPEKPAAKVKKTVKTPSKAKKPAVTKKTSKPKAAKKK